MQLRGCFIAMTNAGEGAPGCLACMGRGRKHRSIEQSPKVNVGRYRARGLQVSITKKLKTLAAGVAPLALVMTLHPAPAFAQDVIPAEEPKPAEESVAETIVVTGSRISIPGIDSVSPVQVIGSDAIQQSGVANIQDLLLENPAFGTPTISRTNSAFLTSGTGVATVDLRDLGSDRTLVLINGRRVVAGLPGTSTVDLNVIPTQFVERVDILTGGASSLYGSDAVAGVVNFIYKKDFEGLDANLQYGITEEGDDKQYQSNVTLGTNFADDRGNIMVHLGYSDQRGVLSRDRRNTRTDDIDTFQLTGDPDDYGVPTEPFFSSFAPQGSFAAGPYRFTFGPSGALQPCFTSNGPTCISEVKDEDGNVIVPDIGTGVGPNGFNRQAFRTIAVPVERYLLATRAHYDVTDSISFFAEGTYSNTSSSREIEPFALSSDNIFPASGGLVPIETLVNGQVRLNPFVPAAIAAAAVDRDNDGLRDISFARRLNEFGSRNGSTNRDFFRLATGFEGDILADRFHWDVSYVYGKTSESQRSNGQVNVLNFANALAAITDVNDLDNDGNIAEAICASATARAQGCVPINIFGAGSISPEAVQYIAAPQSFQTRITQQVLNANLSGALFELPAGPVGLAVGGEYRKETSVENNDALTNAGLNGGNALPDTSGKFDVKEVYGEINVPILADKPFFDELSLRAAVRIADYSTVGGITSYSGGLEWAPVKDLRFRVSYARSVRAPNVGELFTGPSQDFPAGLQDPCEDIAATGGGTLGDNCRADPGVAANIAANGVFTLNQADLQGISGFNSGNPDLSEETSDSFTLGVVINPTSISALRNLALTIDYFNITVKDAIVAPPRQFILDQCFALGQQQFCDLIDRRATDTAVNSAGSLEFVDAPLVNGGKLKVAGIDAVVNYRAKLNGIGIPGAVNARLSYTHYFDGFVVPVPGADKDPFAGEIGTARDRFTANLNYELGDFRLNFTGTYIGKSYEDDQFLAAFDLGPKDISIPSQFYLDMQTSYKITKKFEVYFGIDNLLDHDAPNILSGSPFNTTGTDTAADVYDAIGRRGYAGVRIRL
jgi:outer membrane receptor protein involved in Fe transport